MAGKTLGLGSIVALLVFTSACGGKSAITTGSASDEPSTETELACLSPDGTRVLFGDYETGFAVAGEQVVIAAGDGIRQVPLAGGDSVLLATASDPAGPRVLDGNAYFAFGMQLDFVPVSGSGAKMTSLAVRGDFDQAAVDEDSLYFASPDLGFVRFTPPSMSEGIPFGIIALIDAIAVHGNYIYVASQQALAPDGTTSSAILRLPKNLASTPTTTSNVEMIVPNIGHPWHLVVDDSGLYWAEDPAVGTFGPGHIAHANLDGSNVSTLVADTSATSLALHDGHLYFSTADTIFSVPVAGGTPTAIVTGQKSAGALAVAGRNLLWIDPAERALSDPTVPAVLTACIPQ